MSCGFSNECFIYSLAGIIFIWIPCCRHYMVTSYSVLSSVLAPLYGHVLLCFVIRVVDALWSLRTLFCHPCCRRYMVTASSVCFGLYIPDLKFYLVFTNWYQQTFSINVHDYRNWRNVAIPFHVRKYQSITLTFCIYEFARGTSCLRVCDSIHGIVLLYKHNK